MLAAIEPTAKPGAPVSAKYARSELRVTAAATVGTMLVRYVPSFTSQPPNTTEPVVAAVLPTSTSNVTLAALALASATSMMLHVEDERPVMVAAVPSSTMRALVAVPAFT